MADELIVKIIGDASHLSGELDKAGGQVDNFSKKIDQIGTAMLGIGTAITAAAATIVTKTANIGDQFDKMSKRTGVAVEDLSALSYAAEISGTNIETVENGLRMLASNIKDASEGVGQAKDTFENLGIAVVDVEGNLRPTVEVVKDAATKIADLEDETMQVALAGEIFGKRYGSELLPLLKEGGEGIDELMERAYELGIVISTEAAESAAEYTDRMTDLTESLAGTARVIGDTLIPAIIPLIEKATEIIGKVSEWIAANPELVETIAKIGVVLMAGGAVIKGLMLVKGAIAAIGTMTTGPIGLLILAIGGVYLAWKNWDKILEFIQEWKGKIVKFLEELKEGAIRIVKDMIEWIIEKFQEIANLPQKMKEWGQNAINSFTDGIKSKVSEVTDSIKNVAGSIVDFLGFRSPPPKGPLADSDKWMPKMMDMFADGIERGIPYVSKATEKVGKTINDQITKAADNAVKTTENMMDDMGNVMEEKAITVIEPTKTFSSNFMDIFKDLKTTFKKEFIDPVITYIADYLTEAIWSLLDNTSEFTWSWSNFWDGLKNIVKQAVNAILKQLLLLAANWVFMTIFGFPLFFDKGGGVGYAKGGKAEYYQEGGPKGTDIVPAWLTPGEYVISKEMTNFIKRFRAIPQNLVEAIAGGFPTPTPAFAGGGLVGNIPNSNFGNFIHVDIHDNKISDDIDIRRLANTVSNEIVRKLGKDRRF
jgi:TP901 family phage tail tape measure protein